MTEVKVCRRSNDIEQLVHRFDDKHDPEVSNYQSNHKHDDSCPDNRCPHAGYRSHNLCISTGNYDYVTTCGKCVAGVFIFSLELVNHRTGAYGLRLLAGTETGYKLGHSGILDLSSDLLCGRMEDHESLRTYVISI